MGAARRLMLRFIGLSIQSDLAKRKNKLHDFSLATSQLTYLLLPTISSRDRLLLFAQHPRKSRQY
jgi:hypothetical protein